MSDPSPEDIPNEIQVAKDKATSLRVTADAVEVSAIAAEAELIELQ